MKRLLILGILSAAPMITAEVIILSQFAQAQEQVSVNEKFKAEAEHVGANTKNDPAYCADLPENIRMRLADIETSKPHSDLQDENMALDQAKQEIMNNKKLAITLLVDEHLATKPSAQMKHWAACSEVNRVVNARDLRQVTHRHLMNRLDTQWEHAKREANMDTTASFETVDHNSKSRGGKNRHGKTMVIVQNAETFGDDSPTIATHKMSLDDMTQIHVVQGPSTPAVHYSFRTAAEKDGVPLLTNLSVPVHKMPIHKMAGRNSMKVAKASVATHRSTRPITKQASRALKFGHKMAYKNAAHDSKSKSSAKVANKTAAGHGEGQVAGHRGGKKSVKVARRKSTRHTASLIQVAQNE